MKGNEKRYFAIFKDGVYREYSDPKYLKGLDSLMNLEQESSQERNGQYINQKHEYRLLNQDGEYVESLDLGKLKILNIRTQEDQWYNKIVIILEIQDDKGVVQTYSQEGFYSLPDRVSGLYSTSWGGINEVYKLKQRVEFLEKTVDRLNKEKKNLQNQLDEK